MEKSNLANQMQVFRQLVSGCSLQNFPFLLGACFCARKVQSDYLYDHRLQKQLSYLKLHNGCLQQKNGEWLLILG
jgi:hypothetical protein